jgi:hypothetical protein
MHQWEYVRAVESRKSPYDQQRPEKSLDQLNELGAVGFELVGVVPGLAYGDKDSLSRSS